jgi:hypothetical protein
MKQNIVTERASAEESSLWGFSATVATTHSVGYENAPMIIETSQMTQKQIFGHLGITQMIGKT